MKLNEQVVRDLPAPPKGNRVHYFAGVLVQGSAAPRGFGVNVNHAGTRSFVLNYRVGPRERRITIGRHPDWNCVQAVREARTLRQRIDRGEDPLADRTPASEPEAATLTVSDVIADYLKRDRAAKSKSANSYREYQRALQEQIAPVIGAVPIAELKRSHVVKALDTIEDNRGPVAAHNALAYLRACLNWHAGRTDDFVPPFTKGMGRVKPGERARDRVLSEDEVAAVWHAASSKFGAFVKVLLLTGQRRTEVIGMRRSEIAGDVWVIPAERSKLKKRLVVPVSAAVLAIVAAQPEGDLVFAGRASPIGGISRRLKKLQREAGVDGWSLHDLRRTCRTMLVRAGIRPDIAERCIGHEQRGVAKIYDRHDYMAEMRTAFAALAAYVDRIVNPVENVVALRG